jgi:hypothetical protein
MKKILSAIILLASLQLSTKSASAQLTAPANGGNKKASVSERIGITDVTIDYSRPTVKKRDGHIWGELIPAGYTDQGFGSSKAAPWRAGANNNTTFEFSTDVKIDGQVLPAGKYGFFVAYDPKECTVIFSKNSTSWGSFFYNPAEDALKVKIKPVPIDKSVEWLKYEFTDQTPNSATVLLQWEKLAIPLKIEVDLVNTQLASFRRELRNTPGFQYRNWTQAAQFCEQNKTNLPEALLWIDTALKFGGQYDFQTYNTKAKILDGLGRTAESDAVLKKGLPFGQAGDLHQYGRELIARKKNKEAFDIFKMNYDKHPNEFTTNMGMARGYSAIGDYKNALAYAQKAVPQAPDKPNKDQMDKVIKTLQDGKDIN